ncbi:hypothetical protein EXIGLDRAFT_319502 [Exidia glandulosa HHB12029]|uniref:Uncharacterized protein n=1 Tax=Exidia glandulosa HHB12029 TaxID=1314781 RepID=A0A165Q4A6_EXIGL|nr:hypothetical protein EXIGLDRAFT_319502 [Exidia glandulosa HHB12029]
MAGTPTPRNSGFSPRWQSFLLVAPAKQIHRGAVKVTKSVAIMGDLRCGARGNPSACGRTAPLCAPALDQHHRGWLGLVTAQFRHATRACSIRMSGSLFVPASSKRRVPIASARSVDTVEKAPLSSFIVVTRVPSRVILRAMSRAAGPTSFTSRRSAAATGICALGPQYHLPLLRGTRSGRRELGRGDIVLSSASLSSMVGCPFPRFSATSCQAGWRLPSVGFSFSRLSDRQCYDICPDVERSLASCRLPILFTRAIV